MSPSVRLRTLGALSVVAATAVHAPAARACGGFFCDAPTGPNPVPIAQSGENVLFAVDEDPATGVTHLEAHVQIFYSGPATQFSWIVPVDAKPTLAVGSNGVFALLEASTRPRVQLDRAIDGQCGSANKKGVRGTAAVDDASPAPHGAGGPVSVDFRGEVGPYDSAIIHSEDTQSLVQWLASNGYFVSDAAKGLIEGYVAERKTFVALKLQSGRSTGEIEPIVLRFDGPGPCVPLKLTSIASLDDLRVNLWVLGRARAVPDNYLELRPNLARLSWFDGGSNYQQLVSQAANEAGGQAFLTEYAGSPLLAASSLRAAIGSFDRSRVASARRVSAVASAIAQLPSTPQLRTLLQTYVPKPNGVQASDDQFYSNLAAYGVGDLPIDAASAEALAAALDDKIVQPLRDFAPLFEQHAKLTRLVTFISPDEMTKDPTFLFNPSLPDVANLLHATARLICGDHHFETCEAPVRLEVDGYAPIWYRQTGCQPDATTATFGAQPALEVAFQRADVGEGTVRYDNRAQIAASLAQQSVPDLGGCSCRIGASRSARRSSWPALLGLAALGGRALTRRRRRR